MKFFEQTQADQHAEKMYADKLPGWSLSRLIRIGLLCLLIVLVPTRSQGLATKAEWMILQSA